MWKMWGYPQQRAVSDSLTNHLSVGFELGFSVLGTKTFSGSLSAKDLLMIIGVHSSKECSEPNLKACNALVNASGVIYTFLEQDSLGE